MKVFVNLLLVLFVFSVLSCDKNKTDTAFSIDYIPVGEDNSQFYKMLGKDGSLISIVDSIPFTPNFVIDNYLFRPADILYNVNSAFFCLSDGSFVYDKSIGKFDYAGLMSEGLIPVCEDGEHIQVINESGEPVFSLSNKYFGNYVKRVSSCSHGVFRTQLEDDSWIYIDKEGNPLFEKIFDYATDFVNGYALVRIPQSDESLFFVIDTSGKEICAVHFDSADDIVFRPSLQRLSGERNDKSVIYDFDGNIIYECNESVYDIYAINKDGFIFENEDGDYGLMDYEGNLLILPKYSQLVCSGDVFLGLREDDGLVDVLDENGIVLKNYSGEKIIDFVKFGFDFPCAIVGEDESIGLISKYGRVINKVIRGYEFEDDMLEKVSFVESQFLDYNALVENLYKAVGDGNFKNNEFGLYINNGNGQLCYVRNLDWLRKISVDRLKNSDIIYFEKRGLNYSIAAQAVFSENIVSSFDRYSVNAHVLSIKATIRTNTYYQLLSLYKFLKKSFLANGCKEISSTENGYIMEGADKKYLYIIMKLNDSFKRTSLRLYVCMNNSYNRDKYKYLILK